jgi:LysM repeat protein
MKATARQNYDFLILQATENSIPFYESMGFIRVGCVQGKTASPDAYVSNPVFEYYTTKNGETPSTIAKEYGVDAWDVVFLNRPLHGNDLVQKSWLKSGTKMFVPKVEHPCDVAAAAAAAAARSSAPLTPKWYMAEENETPRGIAKKLGVDFAELLRANKRRYPDLVGHSKLLGGTRVQISHFHVDEGSDSIAYSHWTFPDADVEDNDTSYMMAMRLNRKKGIQTKERPVADSLAVTIQPYDPESCGVKDLLLQPEKAQPPLAPVFAKRPTPREPQKPKRPVTSYAHFTVDARSSMAGKLEGLPFNEVNKILSEKWRAMSDEDKVPYQEKYEESKVEYLEAMEKYEVDMARFQREGPDVAANSEKEELNLLEKVVKLKSTDGIVGASRFEYYYVLTFIRDLHWVHLIPMRKNGVFGPECPDACGRPIWSIVGEDEGKEIDTTASLCQPVTAITMRNSADADDEQWNIYDNGEIPPPPRPVPTKPNSGAAAGYSPDGAPIKPKKPATSFAFFCADAKNVMNEQLENKTMAERTKVIAERWNAMNEDEKRKYKDQQVRAHEKYAKLLKQYKKDMEKFERENPGMDISSKTPKSSKKKKASLMPSTDETSKRMKASLTPVTVTKKSNTGQGGKFSHKNHSRTINTPGTAIDKTPAPKRGRGRPRKNPLPVDMSAVGSKKKSDVQAVKKDPSGLENVLSEMKAVNSPQPKNKSSKPGHYDIVLSFLNDMYKVSDSVTVT